MTEEERIQEEISRTRMPKGKEVIGYVEELLGAKRMYVECTDGKRRLCRVPGRAKRRVWVREGDYVLVEPWPIQGDERGDIIWKYKPHQVEYLKRKGMLKGL
ncbi:MAG: translation initiation factor eIF-1A [Candidatus Diapherotrites archaeon]|nr:translation initiation factor eIF-1A [Candidatus Diapherotrites archaeon]